jgi:outer membrane protein assembly factor BamB
MRRALITAAALLLSAACGACSDLGPKPTPGRELPVYGGVTRIFRVPTSIEYGDVEPGLDEKRLYADLSGGRGVVALNRATGEQIWHAPRPPGGPKTLVVHRGRVLFAGGWAVALDASTGRELWRVQLDTVAGLGATSAHENGFYFGTAHEIYALSVEDGSLLWRTDVGPDWQYRGIVRGVSVGGDTVYANVEQYVSLSGHLAYARIFALDRHTGRILWTFSEGNGNDRHMFMGKPTVAGDLLLVSDHAWNTFLAIDRATGTLRWRSSRGVPDGYFGPFEPPKVSNDTVFISSVDRRAYALDLRTGRILWSTVMGGSAMAQTLCGSRILSTDHGTLFVLERATGKIVGTFYDKEGDWANLFTQAFASDGEEAFVLGTRYAYGFRCPR